MMAEILAVDSDIGTKIAELWNSYPDEVRADIYNKIADIQERLMSAIAEDCATVADSFGGDRSSGPGRIIADRIRDRFSLGFCSCCGVASSNKHDPSCVWS